jgi:predicted solute-binding protein
MKIKIAYPENDIYKPLIDKEKAKKFDFVDFYPCPENRCMELIHNGRVDVALMTPLGYAQGIKKGDFRVIPGPALAYAGKSDIVSIFLKENAKQIDKIAASHPDEFLIILSKIILAERFNIMPKLEKSNLNKDDILNEYNGAIFYGKADEGEVALDLFEEWLFSYEIPLPIAFWACRAEEKPQDIEQVLSDISTIKTSDKLKDINVMQLMDTRRAATLASWSNELKNAVEQTVELLYYHQIIDDIAKIKEYEDKENSV